MAEPRPTVVLGSASPRRRALLAALGVDADVRPVAIEEQNDTGAGAVAVAKFAALRSLLATGEIGLTADTLVGVIGQGIYGKPDSLHHARKMLVAMSGATLVIVTAVCVGSADGPSDTAVASTTVRLRDISPDDIDRYLATGTALDKAGGLALQGEAGRFIDEVRGCWSNVIGLPICVAAQQLADAGVGGIEPRRCAGSACGRNV